MAVWHKIAASLSSLTGNGRQGRTFICCIAVQSGADALDISALCGGVDGVVAAALKNKLVHRAWGSVWLHCKFVDHGLIRYKVCLMAVQLLLTFFCGFVNLEGANCTIFVAFLQALPSLCSSCSVCTGSAI